MIKIYNGVGNVSTNNYTVHEDTETGMLQLVCESSVVGTAMPDQTANYNRILSSKRELISIVDGCLY